MNVGSIYTDNNNFNSIKVRLERFKASAPSTIPIFQFHKGTIRTSVISSNTFHVQIFQFHKGTIRTHSCDATVYNLSVFQFHKGTIRTVRAMALHSALRYFNSIKVRLEPGVELIAQSIKFISIP